MQTRRIMWLAPRAWLSTDNHDWTEFRQPVLKQTHTSSLNIIHSYIVFSVPFLSLSCVLVLVATYLLLYYISLRFRDTVVVGDTWLSEIREETRYSTAGRQSNLPNACLVGLASNSTPDTSDQACQVVISISPQAPRIFLSNIHLYGFCVNPLVRYTLLFYSPSMR